MNGRPLQTGTISIRVDNQGIITDIYGQLPTGTLNSVEKHPNQPTDQSTLNINPSFDGEAIAQSYLTSLSDVGQWQIDSIDVKPTITLIGGHAVSTYDIWFYAENSTSGLYTRPRLVIRQDTLDVLQKHETLNHAQQAGSGLGGNALIQQRNYSFIESANDALSANTFLVQRNDDRCVMHIDSNGNSWKNQVEVRHGQYATDAFEYLCNAQGYHEENRFNDIGAYSPINDAAFHAQVAFNLYERYAKTRARGPLNDPNRTLQVRTSYGPIDSAFWNGEFIALGDGFEFFYPMVSADSLGHELAHAVLENYTSLDQTTGFSFGIAESFADIAGEATEYAIAVQQGSVNDWKFNAESFKPTADEAARYFADPAVDGRSIASLKDWHPGVIGHHLGGVFNKAFYTLVTDNDGWTPIIGYDLWMTAATDCWSGLMSFESAADCILDSASNFRQNNSDLPADWSVERIEKAIINAFANVDVMTQTNHVDAALFDFTRFFDQYILSNHSSTSNSSGPSWEWDLDADGDSDQSTHRIDQSVRLIRDPDQEAQTVSLTMRQGHNVQTYSKAIPQADRYCQPSGFGGNTDYIKQVALNGQAWPASTTQPSGYADYSDLAAVEMTLGQDNHLTLTPNDTLYSRRWSVFIDLNGDDDFLDDGERLISEKQKGEWTATLQLPENAQANGKTTRMRVLMDWANNTRPCAYAKAGEYEDYRVRFTEETAPAPEITFNAVAEGLNVTINNTSQHVPTNAVWAWKVNDSDTPFATSYNASITFESPGTYRITLEMTLDGKTSKATKTVEVSATNDDYCLPGSDSDDVHLTFVALSGTGLYDELKSETAADNGYRLFDTQSTLVLTKKYYLDVKIDKPTYDFNAYRVSAWIDFNRDGSFANEERVMNRKISHSHFQQFEVPTESGLGETRMRVLTQSIDVSNPDPCRFIPDGEGSGEVEDYPITLSSG
ncbi:hemagglutinin/protease [Reinekea sp. MED297]|uniref:Hemagglutinin/protease n=2 Tax=Reinekea TaxID=230494 RepID=A4BAV4_9GAMM|nr:hemagglutinin/protease [Reinekea sp. MED297] [Reinekea blandensis MED297]